MWWSTRMQKQVNLTLKVIIVTLSQIVSHGCLFAEKSISSWAWWLSPALIPTSSCLIMLSCLPHVCLMVSLSVWLFGFALDDLFLWLLLNRQTHLWGGLLLQNCKACACLCLVRQRCVCVWVCVSLYVLREGVQRLLGMSVGKPTSALIWSLSLLGSR